MLSRPSPAPGAVLQTLARVEPTLDLQETDAMDLSFSSSDVLAPLTARDPDQAVIWLDGEHDVNTLSALTDTLTRAVGAHDSDVIVDLSGVTFMCAATVGALIGGRNSLRRQSRSLTLRSPSRFAGRILDLCGLPLEDPGRPSAAR